MKVRVHREDCVLDRPFALAGWSKQFPADCFSVKTGEVLIADLSFAAWRRAETMSTWQATAGGTLIKAIPIDSDALTAAQAANCIPAASA